MPSALETLVKILKLEREQGYKNTAVMGGLSSFSQNWERTASPQARRPEHLLLVQEISAALRQYDAMGTRDERHNTITYLMDRITNRAPMPETYRARLPELEAEFAARAAAQAAEQGTAASSERPPGDAEAPPRDNRGRRDQQDRREQRREQREARPPRDQTSAAAAEHERRGERPPRDQQGRREQRRRDHPDRRPVVAQPPHDDSSAQTGATSNTMADSGAYEAAHDNTQHEDRGARPPRDAREQGRENQQNRRRENKGSQPRENPRPVMSKPPRGDQPRADDEDVPASYDDFGIESPDDFEGAHGPVKMDIPMPVKLARPPRRPRPAFDPAEAVDILRGLNAPVATVSGVGPKMEKLLNKVGMYTINDLLYFLPRRYDDYTRINYISRLQENMRVTVIGTVRHTEVRIGRNSRRDFYMVIDDGTASMGVTFFGQFYLQRQIRTGQQLRLHGDTSIYGNRIQMTNPEWDYLDVEDLQAVRIVPVYPLTEGLTPRFLRRLMERTINYWADRIPDYVPESVLERADLADLGWALKNLHFPESDDHLMHARRRFIFDQLLLLQLGILANRREWQRTPSIPINVSDETLNHFLNTVFPYPLTGAQRRAIEDIRRDIAQTVPMNRLLEGDVGSGKTAVAVTALAMAVLQGKQAALMAPTSILAEQHYRGIGKTLEQVPPEILPNGRPIRVALLTGSINAAERTEVYEGLANGIIDVVIGTHAIIQEGVEFRELALAIIDEQHRFGVEQRGALRGKGTNPHLLVMTATPIPRTLALTVHADLDLSVIDEMPPGRIPVQTYVVWHSRRERVYEFIENELNQGRQAFIVYPLVEASETMPDVKAAVDEYEKLQKVFFHHKVGLLHGRMKPSEKDEIMADFRDHRFDVLVTTSVAEVGVDIPNASVILIEGANRFGLAQLHQFRGRVGRGGHASHCFLLSDSNAADAIERLKLVRDNPNGFDLAQRDFEQRGAGDLIGTRQSGRGDLQLGELMSPELVALAQREARTIYEEDIDLTLPEHRLLAQRVHMLKDERADVS